MLWLTAMAENKAIHPRLPQITHDYLQDLTDIGAYGSNPTGVARTLIEEGVRKALAEKIIKVRRSSRGQAIKST